MKLRFSFSQIGIQSISAFIIRIFVVMFCPPVTAMMGAPRWVGFARWPWPVRDRPRWPSV
jgi:hypothetical protein